MLLQDFMIYIGRMEGPSQIGLDDSTDKLNFIYTVWLLAICCSIATAKTYFTSPIVCYTPSIFGSHEGQEWYVNNICYTEGTYSVSPSEFQVDATDPNWEKPYRDRKIYYYQWVPLLLGLQGVAFCCPRILWQLIASRRAGIDLFRLLRIAHEASRATAGDDCRSRQEKLLRHCVGQLELWLRRCSDRGTPGRLVELLGCLASPLARWSTVSGLGLSATYLGVKCLCTGNLVCQLLLMAKVLQLDDITRDSGDASVHRENAPAQTLPLVALQFGGLLLRDLLSGKDWRSTGLFPRTGCCAVLTRQASGAQILVAQCVLPVNMIHEKMFICLWLWFSLLLLLTLLSLAAWLAWLLPGGCHRRRQELVERMLVLGDAASPDLERRTIRQFVNGYLRRDGALLMRMLALNCGQATASAICCGLYRRWKLALLTAAAGEESARPNASSTVELELLIVAATAEAHATAVVSTTEAATANKTVEDVLVKKTDELEGEHEEEQQQEQWKRQEQLYCGFAWPSQGAELNEMINDAPGTASNDPAEEIQAATMTHETGRAPCGGDQVLPTGDNGGTGDNADCDDDLTDASDSSHDASCDSGHYMERELIEDSVL